MKVLQKEVLQVKYQRNLDFQVLERQVLYMA